MTDLESLKDFCNMLNGLVEWGATVRVLIAVPTGESVTPRKFRCKAAFHVEQGKIAGYAIDWGPFGGLDPWHEFFVEGIPKPT
ncbi:MAG: hypothetical protein NVS4B9_38860 [Ktedonobacteraceae bacterium]